MVMAQRKLTFFDACAGIGCFHHGMKAAGFECVGAAELDERLQKEYPEAFGLDPARMFGNLHGITEAEEWKAVREAMMGCVLTAGFPCQPFSKSGDQLGTEHEEGTVFEALMEVALDLECPAIFLENVENLTGKKHKKTFEEMRERLCAMGFDIAYKKISPHAIGIPQHRQRWFIIGIKTTDGSPGEDSKDLLRTMIQAIETEANDNPCRELIADDFFPKKELRRGTIITDAEREALLIWDTYLAWMNENKALELPGTMWGMEAQDAYSIDHYQQCLTQRKGKPLLKSQLIGGLRVIAKRKAKTSNMTKAQIVKEILPPYLKDLATRTSPYKEFKPRHINTSRGQLMAVKDWLKRKGRQKEWTAWKRRLLKVIPSYQKLEWNVKDRPSTTTHPDDIKRLKTRFGKYLIQFRSSGVRIGRSDRHPALVAIGQVPVVGKYLKRPPWSTLTRLQSIPQRFVRENRPFFLPESHAIKRLGNAVSVALVTCLAAILVAVLRSEAHRPRLGH
jgi:DNA (cytosine-5)-methyltransferase 1